MKSWVKNYLLRHLFNVVIREDVITTVKGVLYLGGRKMSDNELRQLQAEVKALEGFRVWSIMTNSVRYIAQDKIFNKSLNFEEVMAGKMMLFNLDTIESIARKIKSLT